MNEFDCLLVKTVIIVQEILLIITKIELIIIIIMDDSILPLRVTKTIRNWKVKRALLNILVRLFHIVKFSQPFHVFQVCLRLTGKYKL